jgi:alpha-beta hydrolase superfamily lysophospholipase
VHVELRTADGVRLSAHHVAAHGAARAAVVVAHGFGGGVQQLAALVDALRHRGCAVLTYDSRGHGASEGATTLGDEERLDVAAAVDAARDDALPLVLVGESMGAIGVLRYAAEPSTDVAGVVTVSAPARWYMPMNARAVLSALLTQTPPGRWAARQFLGIRIAPGFTRHDPPATLVTRLRAPIAVVHGLADPFIPARAAEELHAAADDPKRIDLVVGMGHAVSAAAVAPIVDAVDWTLEQRR